MNHDGTGPDGKGPKQVDKGFPQRYRNGQGNGNGQGCRRQGGSGGRKGNRQCKRN